MMNEVEVLENQVVEENSEETLDQMEAKAEEIINAEREEKQKAKKKSKKAKKDEAVDFSEASQLDFSDVEDDTPCEVSLELRKRVVESLLFISDKPVGLTTFVSAFGDETPVSKFYVREALEALEDELIEQDRGFRLHNVAGGYQLRTADDLKDYLQNTIKARSFRLTGPSLETLAMVAYKQPCTKSQIDEIRGVDSSHLVRALMDRGLLTFAGKSELPGKPMLYKTTTKFLETFGLRNIKELPSLSEIEALLPNGIGDEEEEKETLSDLAGKLGEDFEGSYSAGEEELGKINDQLSTISTETEFFEQEKQREKERKELEKAEDIREALMVGEEVSVRDQRWLERYDLKMNPPTEEGEQSDEVVAVAANVDISDEALEEEQVLASTDEETLADAESEVEGLSFDEGFESEEQVIEEDV